jgi:glycosyltransferase involved in cell wall biosynthesis
MAQAAREILLEPGKAEEMGRAARRRVEHVFRWDDAAASLVEVFEDTIRATHRRSRAA